MERFFVSITEELFTKSFKKRGTKHEKKKYQKPLLLLMCIALICALMPTADAASVVQSLSLSDENVMQPMYNYTANTNTELYISGNTATCKASITGYNGTTTKVKIQMTLQKKSFLSWNDVETWTIISLSYKESYTKTRSVESGTYRVKAVYTAYKGTDSETITKYSASKSV